MTQNERKVIVFSKFGTQAELARYTGIEKAAISRIVTGQRVATAEQKTILKKALEVGEEFFRNEKKD